MLGKPKYNYGDIVMFKLDDEHKTGIVAIIDKYGTFEQNVDVSYDILNKEDNILYKHVMESLVEEKLGEVPKEDIWKIDKADD